MAQSKAMVRYLDVLARPLNFHSNVQIPDGVPPNTISLVDFYDMVNVSTPTNLSAGTYTVQGVGVYFSIGQNIIQNNSVSATTTTTNLFYSLVFFYIDGSGHILNWDATTVDKSTDTVKIRVPSQNTKLPANNNQIKIVESVDSKTSDEDHNVENLGDATGPFWSQRGANYQTTFGTTNGYDPSNTLVTSFRVASAGFRLLPTIEVITDSSTQAISRWHACNMTPQSLYDVYNDQTDIYTAVQSSINYNEYTNAQGVTCRVNPWQRTIMNMTDLQSLGDWNSDTMDTSNLFFPLVVTKFTTNYSVLTTTQATLCLRATFRIHLEGCLRQPTPLIAQQGDRVPMCREIAEAFVYDVQNNPPNVSGHTFPQVTKAIFSTLASIDPRFRVIAGLGSSFYNSYRRYMHQPTLSKSNKLYRDEDRLLSAIRGLNQQLEKNKGAKPKKQRKNKKQNKKQNNQVRNNPVKNPNYRMRNFNPQYNNQGVDRSLRVRPDLQRILPGNYTLH